MIGTCLIIRDHMYGMVMVQCWAFLLSDRTRSTGRLMDSLFGGTLLVLAARVGMGIYLYFPWMPWLLLDNNLPRRSAILGTVLQLVNDILPVDFQPEEVLLNRFKSPSTDG